MTHTATPSYYCEHGLPKPTSVPEAPSHGIAQEAAHACNTHSRMHTLQFSKPKKAVQKRFKEQTPCHEPALCRLAVRLP